MRIALTGMTGIGSYFAFGWLLTRIYSLGIDVPGIEVQQSIALYAAVAVVSLIAWAQLK